MGPNDLTLLLRAVPASSQLLRSSHRRNHSSLGRHNKSKRSFQELVRSGVGSLSDYRVRLEFPVLYQPMANSSSARSSPDDFEFDAGGGSDQETDFSFGASRSQAPEFGGRFSESFDEHQELTGQEKIATSVSASLGASYGRIASRNLETIFSQSHTEQLPGYVCCASKKSSLRFVQQLKLWLV